MSICNIHINKEKIDNALTSNTFFFSKPKYMPEITPFRKAFPFQTIISFERDIAPDIDEYCCFRDAVYTALYLKGQGYNARVVDGKHKFKAIAINRHPKENLIKDWMTHRWVVVDGKHIDTTIEYGDYPFTTSDFIYKPERIYAPEDLLAFALKVGYDYFDHYTPIWCSTLDGGNYIMGGTLFKWSLIKESGEYFCFNNQNRV